MPDKATKEPPAVVEAAAALRPGQALCMQWKNNEAEIITGFMIRETRSCIQTLGRHPRIKIRTILLDYEKVRPLVVLMRINNQPEMTYEVWLDYCQNSGHLIFRELMEQRNLSLYIYTASQCARRIPVYNNQRLKQDMRKHLIECSRTPPWSAGEFERIKRESLKRYPTVQELWNGAG